MMLKIKLVILTLLYSPHLLLYTLSKNKCVIAADVKTFVATENSRVGGGHFIRYFCAKRSVFS